MDWRQKSMKWEGPIDKSYSPDKINGSGKVVYKIFSSNKQKQLNFGRGRGYRLFPIVKL